MRGRAPFALAAAGVLAAVVVACGGGPPASFAPPPSGAVVISAQGTAFTTPRVTAPAMAPFTVYFQNFDNELHNVHIWDATGASVFIGEPFTGPEAEPELVPALTPGTYRFTCDIHPGMSGQLVAE